jgi:hypothetical protein
MLADLSTGASKLTNAAKALRLAWQEAAEQWNDDTSRAFEEQYLRPLMPKIKTAVDSTNRMAELLGRAERECGN